MIAYLFHALSRHTPLLWGSIVQIGFIMPFMIGSLSQSGHTYHMNTSLHILQPISAQDMIYVFCGPIGI